MPAPPRALGWLWWATMVGAVAGIAIAGYLTVEHYTASTTLACPETGVVNCFRVTTSPQSVVLGVPLSVVGMVFFLAQAVLAVPALWRHRSRAVRWSRLALSVAGALSVVYLVYVELFVVNAICLWCTAVHLLAFGLFVVILYRELVAPPEA